MLGGDVANVHQHDMHPGGTQTNERLDEVVGFSWKVLIRDKPIM